MFRTFSPQKSILNLSLLLLGAMGTLATTTLLPTHLSQLVETPIQVTESNSTTLEEAEDTNRTGLFLAAAIAAGAGIVLTTQAKKSNPVSLKTSPNSTDDRSAIHLETLSRPLQRKLLKVLHDDRGAADRLLIQAELKYPGKSPDWYVEKVIYDLERDRGRY